MFVTRRRTGRSVCCAVSGIAWIASGVMAMLTTERTKVMAAANANLVLALRVNCKAMGVPGIAASSNMPILAAGARGKRLTSRKPTPGIRTQFTNSARTNRERSRRILSNSPPWTRSPIENITTATKKLSKGNGRISMPYPSEDA